MSELICKVWMLFDGRYRTNSDRAICFECCESEKEAISTSKEYGEDTVIVEFETNGREIKNPKIIN